ncbi:MAG: hypothetical protein ACTSYC_11720 [Promethearchaeota archaeon]
MERKAIKIKTVAYIAKTSVKSVEAVLKICAVKDNSIKVPKLMKELHNDKYVPGASGYC